VTVLILSFSNCRSAVGNLPAPDARHGDGALC